MDVLSNVTKETNVSVSVDGTTKFIMENVTEEIMLTEKIPLEKCKLRVLEPIAYHINPLCSDFHFYLVMLKQDLSFFENMVDPEQLNSKPTLLVNWNLAG